MQVRRILAVDQNSQAAEELAIKNNTTKSICGYVVCALCEYLAGLEECDEATLQSISWATIEPYIDRAMKHIAKQRKLQVKKFFNQMSEAQRKSYMTDWVANFEVADYLEFLAEGASNKQLFMFRQAAYDHPQAIEMLKFQEAERVKDQQQFKGEKYFYTSFSPTQNNHKQKFQQELQKMNWSKKPVIIATDVLGHFNLTLLLRGKVIVLDSLPYVEGQYDHSICQAIAFFYKNSFLKND